MKKRYNIVLFLLLFLLSAGSGIYFATGLQGFKMLALQLAHGYIVAWFFTFLNGFISNRTLRTLLNVLVIVPLSVIFLIDLVCIFEFHSNFSEDFIGIMLGSDPAESSEFLQMHIRGTLFSILILSALLAAYLPFRKKSIHLPKAVFLLSVLFLLPCLFLINVNPAARGNLMAYNTAEGKINMFFKYMKEMPPDYSPYATPADLNIISGQPENIVLVFGESHCREHCSFFGYDKETMPELRARMENDNGSVMAFGHVSSPGVNTSACFKSIMSTYQPEYGDSVQFYTCQTLLQIIRDAGYHSAWISNQSKRGFYDNVIGNFAELSDTTLFIGDQMSGMYRKNLDEELIPILEDYVRKVPDGKNFYVIHLMGSHPEFRDRYPEAFDTFKEEDYPDRSVSQRRLFATYDNSLRYTDYVLSQIIRTFEDKETILVYMSDHGLDFFVSRDDYCAHSITNDDSVSAIASREVPLIVYTSPLYCQHFPTVCERIQRSSEREFRTDSLLYTVMDIAGVEFRDSALQHESLFQ